MYHELRTYRLHSPRLMRHMHDRMERHMMPLFAEHGMRAVGSWEMVVGREMPTFFYMLEWDSLAHRESGFDSFYSDPRVAEMTDATIAAAGSEFVRDFDVALLRPADYLPLGGQGSAARAAEGRKSGVRGASAGRTSTSGAGETGGVAGATGKGGASSVGGVGAGER